MLYILFDSGLPLLCEHALQLVLIDLYVICFYFVIRNKLLIFDNI